MGVCKLLFRNSCIYVTLAFYSFPTKCIMHLQHILRCLQLLERHRDENVHLNFKEMKFILN